MRRTPRRIGLTLALTALLTTTIFTGACAARGARNRAQVAALSVGELALELSKTEREIYAAGVTGYTKADHDRVGVALTRVLYATRGYERAVAQWPDGPVPAAVTTALQGLQAALVDFGQALPALAPVRDPLLRAAAALRAALAALTVRATVSDVRLAQLPGGGVLAFMALIQLLAQLVHSGKTTYGRVRDILAQEGATPEQLARLDAQLSDEIARREAEHGA
jgi:hypothetical protein